VLRKLEGWMMNGNKTSHLEVILEDINGKFDLVLEGHITLEHMIHEHRAETRQDKRELQALIQTSHDSLDEKIHKVAAELKETRGELKETREEIQSVDRKLTSEIRNVGQKVEGHEDRIRFMERKMA